MTIYYSQDRNQFIMIISKVNESCKVHCLDLISKDVRNPFLSLNILTTLWICKRIVVSGDENGCLPFIHTNFSQNVKLVTEFGLNQSENFQNIGS